MADINLVLTNAEADIIYDALMEIRYTDDDNENAELIDSILRKIVAESNA